MAASTRSSITNNGQTVKELQQDSLVSQFSRKTSLKMSKKRRNEDRTTLAEAFIQFQIQVKGKEIEEFNNEISELEAKNQKLTELQDQLREEQLAHIRELHKQAKEQEKKLEQREVVNKEQVEQAQRHNLELTHSQEEELEELRRKLEDLKLQVTECQKERQVWLHYKSVGSIEHQQQIQNLQSELTALQKSFEEMSENIKHSLDATFNKIDENTSQLIDEKKQRATERAIKQLDKSSCQEIKENDWLKRELVIYHKEVSIMDTAVRRLEGENLEHMKQIFEHRLNDLQISRNVFLTQAAGLEQMDSSGLEQSVQKLALIETAEPGSAPLPPPNSKSEARGAQRKQAVELEKDKTDPSCKPSSPPHDLTVLLYGSQNDLRELLHLGPLEQKLLSVVGQAVTLYPSPSDSEDLAMSTHTGPSHTQDWALTTRTIRSKFQ
ncbi:coiled-coil domain-containing protein 83 [Colossoma macropomum]|uniref:coiled-coil domain-containing protein 83 n=1 Tax=Colossoma macropomum TaxID=42526 RepID=UPI001864BC12|nr:coiled-coil domain-containing protein 83 [Colossoma macropomum]